MGKKSNTDEFIKKAILVHGDRYDYSKVIYTKSTEKVIIICKEHGEFLQEANSHLRNKGCRACAGNNIQYNNQEFIKKAKIKHGDKYNYSKVDYKNAKDKIIITCKKHGDFTQQPSHHLYGHGCNICRHEMVGLKLRSNTEDFIIKAVKIHGDKYDYSKINYNGNKNKVIIICKEHGDFCQIPSDHLHGFGCSSCSGNKIPSTEEFIAKARLIHKNRYDYTELEYKSNKIKISIICKEHGNFIQQPSHHLNGHGCPSCSGTKKYTTEEFIDKANLVHNNIYNYSKMNYKNNRKKVIIICKEHGEFKQQPVIHIHQKSGCPKCYSNHSKVQIQWLELLSNLYNINIQHAMNEGEFTIPTTRYKADGYCEETNTIYEFHGDYFHGNPKIFKPEEMNKLCKATHGELYQKTLEKEQKIKELGFNLVVMWESDWAKINKAIRCLQNKYKQC